MIFLLLLLGIIIFTSLMGEFGRFRQSWGIHGRRPPDIPWAGSRLAKNRNHENDINFSDEVRIRFLAKTDKITFMPLKWHTSLAPEYPLGVVRPKLESTLSMGAPLLAGIDSLGMTVLLMAVVVVMMMIQGDYSDKGCLRDCDSVRMVNNHSQSLFLITLHGFCAQT